MRLTADNLNELLKATIELLKQMPSSELESKQGNAFELVLQQQLIKAVDLMGCINVTKVELVSGHRYPDIVVHTSQDGNEGQLLGIEVKTSKGKGWSTLGGSIFESTRVANVNSIMLFFANFSDTNNIRFRFDWMENCIADVVITHKPRYAIDMDVEQTFFEQADIAYKTLSQSDKPFSLIRDYLKERSGQKADLWWVEDGNKDGLDQIGPQAIRLFSSLSKSEQEAITIDLCSIFPEVLTSSTRKYERVTLFLISKMGIVHPSIRDLFSAAGQYEFEGVSVPKYFKRFLDNASLDSIINRVETISTELFEEYWEGFAADESVLKQWQSKVNEHINHNNHHDMTPRVKEQMVSHINKRIN